MEDSAGEIHPLRIDQFGYNHIYFAQDLCLLPYLEKFFGVAALRIDAQEYSTEVVALTTKIYHDAIDGKSYEKNFDKLKKKFLRVISVEAFTVSSKIKILFHNNFIF